MDIRCDSRGNFRVLALSGQLWRRDDMDLLERSAGMQSGAGKPRVILDLDGLSFVNSMGLGLLVRLNTWFTAAGGRFILYRPRSTVHDVIAVSGLRRFIAVADTTAELDVLCGEEGG